MSAVCLSVLDCAAAAGGGDALYIDSVRVMKAVYRNWLLGGAVSSDATVPVVPSLVEGSCFSYRSSGRGTTGPQWPVSIESKSRYASWSVSWACPSEWPWSPMFVPVGSKGLAMKPNSARCHCRKL